MKRTYTLKVEGKTNDMALTLRFDTYDAAADAQFRLKRDGFSVTGLNDYPETLHTKRDIDHALETARVWFDRQG